MPQPPENQLPRRVRDHLNRHGFGFQYSVLAEAQRLAEVDYSRWTFQTAEFPIEVQGTALHVDFILKQGGANTFLVAECKRANPALSDWCFVKAPYVRRNERAGNEVVVERVAKVSEHMPDVSANPASWSAVRQMFHLVVEIKGGSRGDRDSNGRGAIDAAIAQVFRGVNGLVEMLHKHTHLVKYNEPWSIVPVVFTTARLWTTTLDLSTADLSDGKITTLPELTQEPWVSLNYPVSPRLRHSVYRTFGFADLSELLANEHLRAVFFVSPPGIELFLRWASEQS